MFVACRVSCSAHVFNGSLVPCPTGGADVNLSAKGACEFIDHMLEIALRRVPDWAIPLLTNLRIVV